VVAYTTRQRTHEIGIRMALGAAKADVFRQVLAQGCVSRSSGSRWTGVSLFLTRFLRGLLFGVGTADWLTFTCVALSLCLVALAACFLPGTARGSIDPMQALRTE